MLNWVFKSKPTSSNSMCRRKVASMPSSTRTSLSRSSSSWSSSSNPSRISSGSGSQIASLPMIFSWATNKVDKLCFRGSSSTDQGRSLCINALKLHEPYKGVESDSEPFPRRRSNQSRQRSLHPVSFHAADPHQRIRHR
ncbi:unnamed protein product [Linum tenue]|uniref:Uncharacterized protein n=1 Tax=Linum tenue TaxID=586396 RepID=A0AAV0MFD8_9ROSI|nr:unnamed protein product [Linum tenue]